jgi:hypothetical protein
MASDSNDLAFVLDDTEKGEDGPGAFVRTIKSVVQMVPGGRSKVISRGVDQARFPQLRWTAFALTSSPLPIPRLATENRWLMSPGDKVRLCDISVPGPAKGGIFDGIEGGPARRAKRSIKLIAKLQHGYTNHHGHAFVEWVIYLMGGDRSQLILQLVNKFIDHVEGRGNGREVRFATKFGLVYAAMQIAIDAGLLPWQPNLALKVAGKEQLEVLARVIESDRRRKKTTSVVQAVAKCIAASSGNEKTLSDVLERCSPLHPLVAALLGPISRRRFGQNQRSLFGFLNSAEPHGFQDFLRDAEDDACYLPDRLWDYLRANLEPSILASPDGHRWSMAVESIERCETRCGDDLYLKSLKALAPIDLQGTLGIARDCRNPE